MAVVHSEIKGKKKRTDKKHSGHNNSDGAHYQIRPASN